MEAVGHQPLADELLGELHLRLAFGETFLILVGDEITLRVGRVDFVHQHDLVANLAELILGVDENQALLGRDFSAALEELAGDVLNLDVILFADESTADDLFARDVLVMAFLGLGGRGDDGLGEAVGREESDTTEQLN